MDWFDLLAILGTLKSLLQHHSSKASVLQCSAFFMVQLSHPYMTIYSIYLLIIQFIHNHHMTNYIFFFMTFQFFFQVLNFFCVLFKFLRGNNLIEFFLTRWSFLELSLLHCHWQAYVSAVFQMPSHAAIRVANWEKMVFS